MTIPVLAAWYPISCYSMTERPPDTAWHWRSRYHAIVYTYIRYRLIFLALSIRAYAVSEYGNESTEIFSNLRSRNVPPSYLHSYYQNGTIKLDLYKCYKSKEIYKIFHRIINFVYFLCHCWLLQQVSTLESFTVTRRGYSSLHRNGTSVLPQKISIRS